MMTARLSLSSQPTTWGNGGNNSSSRRPSIASAAAVDAYAQTVLESQSTEGHEPDDSLGSYVTSLIRLSCSGSDENNNEVVKRARDLPDYESLVELVQEHCSINTEKAENVLERIARAVQTREIPPNIESDDLSASVTQPQQHHYSTEDLIQSMNLLSTTTPPNTNNEMNDSKPLTSSSTATSVMTRTPESSDACPSLLVPDDSTALIPPPVTTASTAETASSIISPVHADNLIPVDLLGALDDPSTPKVAKAVATALTAGGAPIPLPPVASASTTTTKHTSTSKKKEKDEERQRLANDIAAALFQPTATRSRQSSIDETKQMGQQQATTTTTSTAASSASPNLSPNLHATTPGVAGVVVPEGSLYETAAGPSGSGDPNMYYQQHHELHQQQHEWDTAMDILLSLNPDVSEEAASAAAYMAGANVNVAQYLIDSAMSAPPICRHLLHDGCYRSDCTYSHDIDGHSCLFWLRGRCGKGESCRFLHGFDEKLLNDIDFDELEQQHVNEATMNYNLQQQQHHPYGYGLPPQHHHQVPDPSFYPAGTAATATSSWRSEAPGPQSSSSSTTTTSFANIASQGYQTSASFAPTPACAAASTASSSTAAMSTRKVDIPQDLWNAHENRDASVFYITDPIERYHAVSSSTSAQHQQRDDVIDLHFQSTKTFDVVLQTILPSKLERYQQYHYRKDTVSNTPAGIWIVTGTGHHVGSKTHQKGGGALEQVVTEWLTDQGYEFYRGRDRNGQGGAVLVTRKL